MESDWAPVAAFLILAFSVTGVILLRPISVRLGEYLQLLITEKRTELEATRDVEAIGEQLRRIEDRLDFVDRLTEGRSTEPGPPDRGA
jgi:hypothetical protein